MCIPFYKHTRLYKNIRLQVQFFDRLFLAGSVGNIYDIKYIAPVLKNEEFTVVPIYGSNPDNRQFLDLLCEAGKIGTNRGQFYVMRLRNIFLQMWEQIYTWSEEVNVSPFFKPYEDKQIKSIIN